MNNERGFITLPSWSAAFGAFTKARSTADVLFYINQYWTTGEEPSLPEKGEVTVAWRLIKPMLDAQRAASENGKKGGAPKGNQNARKTTPVVLDDTENKTTENNPRCKTTPAEKTSKITDNRLQITEYPPISPQGADGGAFEKFWEAYPKKVGKQDARRSYERATKGKGPLFKNNILKALEDQKQSDQWTRENGRFIPNPATWLNQGRWDDELEKPEPETPPEPEYHPIQPMETCKCCGSDDVEGKGLYYICRSCGASYTWNSRQGEWIQTE